MNQTATAPPVKYVAVIDPVREVTLHGTADLEYWRRHLHGAGLFPCPKDGKAVLLLSAVASRWKGLPFRELSFALPACLQDGGGETDGLYFIAAFNSSRFLAFCERFFFQTPYVRARLDVQEQSPVFFQAGPGEQPLLRAAMGADRPPVRQEGEVWEGRLFLPPKQPGAVSDRYFQAKLVGLTDIWPFAPGDECLIAPDPAHPVLQALVDSQFAAQEWHVRAHAVHARSKTFQREC